MTKTLEIEEGAAPEQPETSLAIKKDHKLNLAQSLLFAMGIRPELLFAHFQEKRYTATKLGPGRTQLSKKPKSKSTK